MNGSLLSALAILAPLAGLALPFRPPLFPGPRRQRGSTRMASS